MQREHPGHLSMRIFVLLFVGISFGVAKVAQAASPFDDPYPYPDIVPAAAQNPDHAVSLILGALVIVVIIWGAVAVRRLRS